MPPQQIPIGTDAANSFEDLSGLTPMTAKTSIPETPYDVLIDACSNSPVSLPYYHCVFLPTPFELTDPVFNPKSLRNAPHQPQCSTACEITFRGLLRCHGRHDPPGARIRPRRPTYPGTCRNRKAIISRD